MLTSASLISDPIYQKSRGCGFQTCHPFLGVAIRCGITKIKIGDYNNCSRKSKRKCKFPCSVCNKNCNENNSLSFAHNVLIGYTANVMALQKLSSTFCQRKMMICPFHCIVCIIQNNVDIFPFGYSCKSEMLDLSAIDICYYSVRSKLTNLPRLFTLFIQPTQNILKYLNPIFRGGGAFSLVFHLLLLE